MKLNQRILSLILAGAMVLPSVSYAADNTSSEKGADSVRRIMRISGDNRYSTAVNISAKMYPKSKNAIIASGEGFADALAGGQLAIALKAPILLTKKSKIDYSVEKRLKDMGVEKIYILGGENSVSNSVESSLRNIADVERLYGEDRYETSRAIMNKTKSFVNTDKVVVVSGKQYPDALSAAGYVAKYKTLMELSKGEKISSNASDVVAIGGSRYLPLSGYNVKRISGSDRYATSVKVAREVGNKGVVILASGENYPDALAAAPLCSLKAAPLVLTKKDKNPADVMYYLENSKADIIGIGGTNSISDYALKSIDPNAKFTDIDSDSIDFDQNAQSSAYPDTNIAAQNGVEPTKEQIEAETKNYVDPADVSPASDFVFDKEAQILRAYKGNSSKVVIPQKIDDVYVRGIDVSAFQDKFIDKVVIPPCVRVIRDSAFASNHIQELTIPLGVEVIAFNAFANNKIKTLKIPGSVKRISENAFHGNEIEKLDLGYGITSLGGNAFSGNKLKEVIIPNSVTTIGEDVFKMNNITKFYLPKGIKEIPTHAFSYNDLKEVIVPKTVTSIGRYAFGYNMELKKLLLPEGLVTIEKGAFAMDSNLSTTTIPSSVKTIGEDAFDPAVKLLYIK